jgi:Flp pilus assembly protein TadG
MRTFAITKAWRAEDNEKGAAGVLVAVMMLVLIGVGAIAVDVGQIYAERAELQNAADSAALAGAQICSESTGCTQADADALALSMANQNSKDGRSNVRFVDLSVPGQVTVSTSTVNGSDESGFLSRLFSSALNTPAVSVGATATAVWENTGAAGVFPLVFDQCQIGTAYAPADTTVLFNQHGKSPCVGSPSGHHIPGGFGWLDETGSCDAAADSDGWVGSNTGTSKTPASCTPTLDAWRSAIDHSQGQYATAYLPIFDDGDKGGSHGRFHLIGVAEIELHGWSFVKDEDGLSSPRSDPACEAFFKKGTDRGICGQFQRFIPWADRFLDPGPYFENSVVRLIQ